MAADQEPVLEFFTTKAGLREHLTRREKQARQIGGPLGREIALCVSYARIALRLGTLDEAEAHLGEIRQILKRVREQPDAETGHKVRDMVRKIHEDRYGTPEQKRERWAAHVATFEEIRAKNGWDVKSSEKEAARRHGVSAKTIQRARKWARERKSHVTRR